MKVPFIDLKTQYLSIKEEIDHAIESVIDKTAFASGPFVEQFEANYAEFLSAKYVAGVNSGTSALHLALIALDIREGDEVITTPHTFVSTVWAITYVKAKPIFVDINPNTYTIDPNKIEEKITKNTKAIIPVHLYGQAADLDPIINICDKYGLALIEDAAQAQGAEYKGIKCGTIGKVGCFSFYPGKNLGAFGEAGAIATNDKEIYERIIRLRNHAQAQKYIHTEIGYNYRMDGMQGAVLNAKLSHLSSWNHKRRTAAKLYNKNLKNIYPKGIPFEPEYSKHIFHLYELQLESKAERDELLKFLHENEIGAGLHYPIAVHEQEAYKHLGYKRGDFPETEKAADRNISLPIFPEITDEMISYVTEKIKEFKDINK